MALMDIGITFTAMIATHSVVRLANFWNPFLEFVAVFLSGWAIRRMARDTNEGFDYGQGKIEHLANLLVGLLMSICLLLIAGNAIRNILHPALY